MELRTKDIRPIEISISATREHIRRRVGSETAVGFEHTAYTDDETGGVERVEIVCTIKLSATDPESGNVLFSAKTVFLAMLLPTAEAQLGDVSTDEVRSDCERKLFPAFRTEFARFIRPFRFPETLPWDFRDLVDSSRPNASRTTEARTASPDIPEQAPARESSSPTQQEAGKTNKRKVRQVGPAPSRRTRGSD